jgi:hypothetical protein
MKNTDETQPLSQPVVEENSGRRMSPFGHLFRFIGWWFGFTGLYAMFAVCPFCGQQGCPVGLTSAGAIGGFLSLCVQDWKRFSAFIMHKLGKRKNHEKF